MDYVFAFAAEQEQLLYNAAAYAFVINYTRVHDAVHTYTYTNIHNCNHNCTVQENEDKKEIGANDEFLHLVYTSHPWCILDSLNLNAHLNVLGLSSEWNILRPYAKKGKRACLLYKQQKRRINAVVIASLYWFICELCNESYKHALLAMVERFSRTRRWQRQPPDPFYNLSRIFSGKSVHKMMLFRKKLHICLLSAQSFRVCTKHKFTYTNINAHMFRIHTNNAVTKWINVSLLFFLSKMNSRLP